MAKSKPLTIDEQIAALRAEIEAEHAKWRAADEEFRKRISAMNWRLISLEMQPRDAPSSTEAHGA